VMPIKRKRLKILINLFNMLDPFFKNYQIYSGIVKD
jgi:hypothetical protein